MKITRRNFLLAAPLAAGVMLQFKGTAFGRTTNVARGFAGTDALSRLGWDSFLPFVNTDFVFRNDTGQAVTLTLSNMTSYVPAGTKAAAADNRSFTLIFTGTGRTALPEQIYSVEHFSLGTFDMFIAPGAVTRRSRAYRAIFDRTV